MIGPSRKWSLLKCGRKGSDRLSPWFLLPLSNYPEVLSILYIVPLIDADPICSGAKQYCRLWMHDCQENFAALLSFFLSSRPSPHLSMSSPLFALRANEDAERHTDEEMRLEICIAIAAGREPTLHCGGEKRNDLREQAYRQREHVRAA